MTAPLTLWEMANHVEKNRDRAVWRRGLGMTHYVENPWFNLKITYDKAHAAKPWVWEVYLHGCMISSERASTLALAKSQAERRARQCRG